MKKTVMGVMGIIMAATFAPAAATAAEEWAFVVTPYLWAAGTDGTLTVKGHSADIGRPFDEIIKDLDLAGMLNLQARNGKFGLYTDVTFIGLSDTTNVELPAAGGMAIDASASVDQWLVDFGASWAVAQWGAGGTGSKGAFDLLLGGRYTAISAEFSTDNLTTGAFRSVKKTTGWIDPIVGARLAVNFTPKFQLLGRADVGGFDLGGSTSKLTWSASATLGWHFTPLVGAYVGWKYLSVERESDEIDDVAVDLALSGPTLGVSFAF